MGRAWKDCRGQPPDLSDCKVTVRAPKEERGLWEVRVKGPWGNMTCLCISEAKARQQEARWKATYEPQAATAPGSE